MPSEIEQLYREHRAGLVRLVERELHDHHDAEDVVQTAFLDAQRALERGTIPRNPRAWLAAIALNAAHRLRRRRLNADPLEEYAVHEASRLPEIRAALASLPTAQRVAVLYRDVFGLSYGETAEQMGTSVNAVTMLLHRGRQRLRQTLAALTDGAGVWRWLQQGGASQVAVVKGAAAIVAAAGLTTAGVATARAVAPVGADATAPPGTRAGSLAAGAAHASRGPAPVRHSAPTRDSTVSARRASAQVSPVAAESSPPSTSPAATGTPSSPAEPATTSTSRLPTVGVSSVTAAVPATVTVSTPVATATVATPTSVTATVSTPITTVTIPIP